MLTSNEIEVEIPSEISMDHNDDNLPQQRVSNNRAIRKSISATSIEIIIESPTMRSRNNAQSATLPVGFSLKDSSSQRRRRRGLLDQLFGWFDFLCFSAITVFDIHEERLKTALRL